MSSSCCTNVGLYGSEHDLNEIRTKLLKKKKSYSVDLSEFLSDEGIVSSTDKRETILNIGGLFEAGDKYGLIIEANDASAPKIDAWTEYLSKNYPDVQCYFLAEDPNNKVFINTDDTGLFFTVKFYLSFFFPYNDNAQTNMYNDLCDLLNDLRPYGIIASSFSEAERIGQMIAENDDSGKAYFIPGEFRREIA